MKAIRYILTTGLVTLLCASLSFAADGTLGSSSTGTTDLDITVPEFVQVTGIQDPLVSTTYGGSGAVAANDDVCVYTNDINTS